MPNYPQFQYQVKTAPVFTEPVLSWHAPFSVPVRTRIAPALAVALLASGATGPVGFIPADIGVASGTWSQPPARTRQVQYQAQAFVPLIETSTLDKWFAPWRDPVRVKPGLPAGEQSVFTGPIAPIETIQVDKWYASWRDPVRLPRRLQVSANPSFFPASTNPAVSFSWFNSLAEPPKPKVGLAAASQQFTAFVQAAPFAEAVLESKWHQPWSEPVRVKPGLRTGAQQVFTTSPVVVFETVTLDKWYFAWTNPPKAKTSVSTANQQFIAFVKAAPFPEATFESKWHYAWSEPVRVKPGLWAAHQVAQDYWNPDTPPTPIVTTIGWFSPLAELPRPKPGLATQYQWSFTAPARVLPTPNITGILNAIETADVAQFGGIIFNPPFGALVGIIEDAVPNTPSSPVVSLASVSVSIREV